MQQVRVEMVAMKRDAENYGLVTQAEAQKVGDSMVRPWRVTQGKQWMVRFNKLFSIFA